MTKDVNYKNYGRYYTIDELGHVKSKPRTIRRRDGIVQSIVAKTLSWNDNTDGYPTVKLSVDGVSERIAVHRLVALTFLPNPGNLPEVNHIDFDRKNPCASNLEWSSHKQNVSYSHSAGRYEKPQFLGASNPKAKRVELVELGARFDCIKDCAQYLIQRRLTSGSVQNAISQIIKVCKGRLNHYLGYHYKYI